jgi:ribosomal protein L16/L10AE
MGNGKGSHNIWSAMVCKGKILLEFEGLNIFWAQYIFNEINNRLPLKIKLIYLV